MQEELKKLINMVLEKVEKDEHVTDHVFCAIEEDPDALAFYKELCEESGVRAVNPAIGKALKELLRREDGGRVEASSNLIGSYTLLV